MHRDFLLLIFWGKVKKKSHEIHHVYVYVLYIYICKISNIYTYIYLWLYTSRYKFVKFLLSKACNWEPQEVTIGKFKCRSQVLYFKTLQIVKTRVIWVSGNVYVVFVMPWSTFECHLQHRSFQANHSTHFLEHFVPGSFQPRITSHVSVEKYTNSHQKGNNFLEGKDPSLNFGMIGGRIPSRELTYPPKMAFWRWFSFSQGGIC